MGETSSLDNGLLQLSRHLAKRRGAVLESWRNAVKADPELTSGATLPRAQLHDHLPALMVNFEDRLAAGEFMAAAEARDKQETGEGDGAAHGLHRWQQGFDLAEVTRELGRFNECVVTELDDYAASQADPCARVMALARRIWAQQCGSALRASTSQYFRLQQLEARGHIQDLEQALAALQTLDQQRAQLWQQAAHDLRGNLGVVATVSAGLSAPQTSPVLRNDFLTLLDRNVAALHHLLDDVTSLAKLQSGRERRQLAAVDVAHLLQELCAGLRPQATARGLTLDAAGPLSMPVQADAVKLRRIAQNLVLNAIKYTRQGGVSVTWNFVDGERQDRWWMQIEDTGPGFHSGPGSELVGALGEATEQARQVDADARTGDVSHAGGDIVDKPATPNDHRPVVQVGGEGIGLSIVKRLCDLLDASIELESLPGIGTRFRILMPLRYPS